MIYYCFVLLLSISHLAGAKSDISLYDSNIFSDKKGEIVGFADFNGDHFTDIFYLTEAGLQLNVMLFRNQPKPKKLVLAQLDKNLTKIGYKIRSIILSDFAGASMLDVVILLSKDTNGPYDAYYSKHIVDSKPQVTLNAEDCFATFKQQPLVFFYNNDDMPVLLAVASTDNLWKIWKKKDDEFVTDENLDQLETDFLLDAIQQPMYSLFFDADMDYASDVMLTDYVAMLFKFYRRQPESYFIDFSEPYKVINFPENAKEIGQPVVADWLRKNYLGLLLAYCTETDCSDGNAKLAFHNLKNDNDWEEVDIQGDFKMTINNEDNAVATRPLIASMRTVDLNLDGYPDVVTTLLDNNGKSVIGILINECNQDELEFEMELFNDKYASEVIPFDFMEDGVPDLLVNHGNEIKMYKTSFYKDNYENAKFLKISVMSGRCGEEHCKKILTASDYQFITYGIPISGASFSLEANATSGDKIDMRGHVISSTSYLALQLPFYLFGLSKNIDQLQSITVATATGWPSVGKLTTVTYQTYLIIIPFFSSEQVKWLSVTLQLEHLDNWSSNKFWIILIVSIAAGALIVISSILLLLRYVVFRPKIFVPAKGAKRFVSEE